MAKVIIDAKFLARSAMTRAERGLWAMGEHWKGAARKTLAGHRTGTEARVPGTGTTYTQSRPGEPPAVRTGNLRSRISGMLERGEIESIVYVGSNVPYAPYLEYGTSRMQPRPWARPTLLREWSLMMQRFAKATGMQVRNG